MTPVRVAPVLVVSAAILSAQTPAPVPTSTDIAFEVASVKLNKSGATNSSTGGRAGSFNATNVTTRGLITYAYRLRPFQLPGDPRWLDADRFDIVARAPDGITDNRAMTRALLATRFKLVAHTETREQPVYALVMASRDGRFGPQFKASPTQDCAAARPGTSSPCGTNSSVNNSSGRMTGIGQSTENLATALSSFVVDRMVIDRTGLKGLFDFELRWTPDSARGTSSDQANDAPSLFAALREQLGLQLEAQRGPVEFLVVDSIAQPTPD